MKFASFETEKLISTYVGIVTDSKPVNANADSPIFTMDLSRQEPNIQFLFFSSFKPTNRITAIWTYVGIIIEVIMVHA